MNHTFTTLSGLWSGVYDYPDGIDDAVPFNAQIHETDGQLSGDIEEPDTFSMQGGAPVTATLDGSRAGTIVSFVKEYHDVEGQDHFIQYEGTADESLTRIEGHWRTIEEDGFSWSGPFVMNRTIGKGQDTSVTHTEHITY